jgi:propanol-preferring alcohol dehydrogenase
MATISKVIPATMRAAVVHKFGEPLKIVTVPTPQPGKGEVLIKVHACGVCHTDLHAVNGDWPAKPKLPFIPGHEGVGEVVAVDPSVERLKVGDRVGVPWLHSACGYCQHCLAGWETLCHSQQNTGYSVNGAYAEYTVAPANYVAVLPEGLSYEEAAPILCAGVTTYKGLKETEARPGQWCVLFGMGGLGHVGLQYAKVMGLNTIAVDISDQALELAKTLGADIVINAAQQDPGKVIWKEVGGAHGCLVTAVSPKAFQQALSTVRRGGTVALVGMPPSTFPLDIIGMVLNRITVRGSIVGTRLDLQECLDIAAKGKVKAHIQKKPLDDINDVLDRMKKGQLEGRIVLSLL